MLYIITSLAMGIGLMFLLLFIRWLFLIPPTPDPWDADIEKINLDDDSKPICSKCASPIEAVNQHYCPKCGNVTGEYTRYLPFENIRFNYAIFGVLWKKLGSRKSCFLTKCVYVLVIVTVAPIMLAVGIPVAIFCMIMRKIKD